jgi:aldose 1-epimerase
MHASPIVMPLVSEQLYGTMPDGSESRRYLLQNSHGVKMQVMEYGAILGSLEVPDRSGHFADITLGYDSLEGWMSDPHYFGATVGRYGNRVRHGRFSLDGNLYQLPTNNAPGGIPCHLHGGICGLSRRLWRGEIRGDSVVLRYQSPDGEEGYPGNLNVEASYSLTEENELTWEVLATTDAPTILNFIQHSYWNLSGNLDSEITDHLLHLNADSYLPTDAGLIPTGDIAPVRNTPMDFTQPAIIGSKIDARFSALQLADGYDHCWVLNQSGEWGLAADVTHAPSGRRMELFTNQPGLQFYSGNFLNGSTCGKKGKTHRRRSGFCLETQKFPDSPNHSHFPTTVLRPGEIYHHRMTYRFSTVSL